MGLNLVHSKEARPREAEVLGPLQHVDSPPKDKWQADSSQDKASQEHNLAESRAHLLQAKAVHTRAAREGNE